jgi:E3 ubiquitin-protein ligase HECTD2
MSDLLGGLEVGDSATLDWSSSDSETQSRSLKPKRISHGRSISNPFPSIFNTGQQSGSGAQANSQRDENTSATKMRSKSGKSSEKDVRTRGKEFATGNCMTCASLVRWPHGVDVFKCTICATVNDLVPMEQSRKSRRGTSRNKGEYTEEPSRDNRANANGRSILVLHRVFADY